MSIASKPSIIHGPPLDQEARVGELTSGTWLRAATVLGGIGYAQEYDIERYGGESLIPRNASVSPHMILNFLAEKVLGLPKSY
jgi:acyl-CoA dehydrogenase